MDGPTSQEIVGTELAGHIEASTLMKAMSNEVRLMILCRLFENEKSVTELEHLIGLSQSAISQHLAVLRENKLVNTKRYGQSIKYSLADAKPRAIIEVLHRLYAHCP
ncbi:MAG: winged helix-turn-helix transcriptional regulator [Rhodospirillales bacterium]|nr:winged helix-turn-helix transcriptional regulator [Rhodospirillales bacterium]